MGKKKSNVSNFSVNVANTSDKQKTPVNSDDKFVSENGVIQNASLNNEVSQEIFDLLMGLPSDKFEKYISSYSEATKEKLYVAYMNQEVKEKDPDPFIEEDKTESEDTEEEDCSQLDCEKSPSDSDTKPKVVVYNNKFSELDEMIPLYLVKDLLTPAVLYPTYDKRLAMFSFTYPVIMYDNDALNVKLGENNADVIENVLKEAWNVVNAKYSKLVENRSAPSDPNATTVENLLHFELHGCATMERLNTVKHDRTIIGVGRISAQMNILESITDDEKLSISKTMLLLDRLKKTQSLAHMTIMELGAKILSEVDKAFSNVDKNYTVGELELPQIGQYSDTEYFSMAHTVGRIHNGSYSMDIMKFNQSEIYRVLAESKYFD